MESRAQLDPSGPAAVDRVIFLFLTFLILFFHPLAAHAQAARPDAEQLPRIKQMYDEGRWSDVVQALPEAENESADLQMYRGLALAKLERWDDARQAFLAGATRHPRDPRFRVELAGIAYRQSRFPVAERELRRALDLQPQDEYSNNLLASIYFLDGNLEAALKYWNRVGQPKLTDLTFEPKPKLNPLVLDRAVGFSPGSEWTRGQYLSTRARLEALGLYSAPFFELQQQLGGAYDLTIHASEKNGWGSTKLEGAASLLRGLPFLTVYPEFYNLEKTGLNWRSLYRWEDQRRRLYSELGGPLAASPVVRYRIYFDGRNENWDVAKTLAPRRPSPAGFNMERIVAGAEMRFIPDGRWDWNVGAAYSYRRFRNLASIPVQAAAFFTDGSSLALQGGIHRSLIRFPARRFTLDSSAAAEVGTFFENPLGRYGRVQGSVSGNWFPKTRGNDYQVQFAVKGGRTFGMVPFDQLFMLGFERDNDLTMRGHPGLSYNQKGNAPLGRNFVLVNSEVDKIAYRNGLFTVRVGPLLDTGRVYDPSGYFGTRTWLWDTGAQTKIRVLDSVEFVLGYGKDLRTGNNSFFTKVSR